MKKEIRGFITGAVTTAILFTTAFSVFGESIEKAISVVYSNIKIYVDGNMVQPKDASGNIVEPFIYNGTTFLPVRAVSQALGKEVDWDGNTNSIYIGRKPVTNTGETTEPKAEPLIEEITVESAEDFVKAIRSNRKILLKPGVYNLSAINQVDSTDGTVTWKVVSGGKELNIQNISNLTIEGVGPEKAKIVVDPRYAYIMNFKNVSNINFNNIIAGHTPQEYACDAGVLNFTSSSNVYISNSELYGCGSIGLRLDKVKNMDVIKTNINHCSLRAIQIYYSEDINIKQSRIVDHEAYSNIISVNSSKNVIFEECEMANNKSFEWSFAEIKGYSNVLFNKCKIYNNSNDVNSNRDTVVYFFDTVDYNGTSGSKVIVKETEFTDNRCDSLTNNKDTVIFENCTFNNNIF